MATRWMRRGLAGLGLTSANKWQKRGRGNAARWAIGASILTGALAGRWLL